MHGWCSFDKVVCCAPSDVMVSLVSNRAQHVIESPRGYFSISTVVDWMVVGDALPRHFAFCCT